MAVKTWYEVNPGDCIEIDGLQAKVLNVHRMRSTIPSRMGSIVAATVEYTRGRWKGNVVEDALYYGDDPVNVVKKKRGGKGYFRNLKDAIFGV
jgi:hypothetical protein